MPVYKTQPILNGQGGKDYTSGNGIQITDENVINNTQDAVIANPELEGTEPDLTGLQVGATKYKVPSGGGSSDSVVYGTIPQILRNSVGKHIDVDALKSLIQSHFPEGVEDAYFVGIGYYSMDMYGGNTYSMIKITADGSSANLTWFGSEVTSDDTYPINVLDLLDNKKQEIEAYTIGSASADPDSKYGLVAKDIIIRSSSLDPNNESIYLILTDEEIASIFADND